MPMSEDFARRLEPSLEEVAEHFGTPFHIYDETGILVSAERLTAAFGGLPFHEYYAVKALPNLTITRMLRAHGLGMECSSIAELELAADSFARGEEIFFTSNNTTREEFAAALSLGAIVNVDDVTLIEKLPGVPAVCSFRFNPGPERLGDKLIGSPVEAKFGLRRDQLATAFARARELGAERFGLHAMIASNVLTVQPLLATIAMLLALEDGLQRELGIELEFINAGGGSDMSCTMKLYIDSTVVDQCNVMNSKNDNIVRGGGELTHHTNSLTSDTPTNGVHTVKWTFIPTSGGNIVIKAGTGQPVTLRVEPVNL